MTPLDVLGDDDQHPVASLLSEIVTILLILLAVATLIGGAWAFAEWWTA